MAKNKKKGLQRWLKLSHHQHTGKRLEHKHTSYGALVVLSVFVGLILLATTRAFVANANAITGDGALNFTGFMPPPEPYPVATIDSPLNGQIFGQVPIDIHGSCATYPDKVLVVVIDNGLNLGQALCDDGRYDFKIDLVISNRSGTNFIRVRQYEMVDNFQAAGFESSVIKIYFHPDSGLSSQLVLSSTEPGTSVKAGQPYELNLNVHGGLAPYAASINWGDGNQDVVSRPLAGDFSLSHVYQAGGNYTIGVNASDSQGQKAFLQSATVISGTKKTSSGGIGFIKGPTAPYVGHGLAVLWPTYSITLGYVVIFWLGEKFAYHQAARKLWKTRRLK